MFNVRFFKGDTITAQSIKLIKKGKIVFALQQTIVIMMLQKGKRFMRTMDHFSSTQDGQIDATD